MTLFIGRRLAAAQLSVELGSNSIAYSRISSKHASDCSHSVRQAERHNAYQISKQNNQQRPQGVFMASILPSLVAYIVD